MSAETITLLLGGVILVALIFYALLGGADYGGGVWDLLAFGPRQKAQRLLIAQAIGPVWEANHVWLILVVVVLFTAFPPAFALISTHLNVPLTVMLVAIVLRGAAFTFRAYDTSGDAAQKRWSVMFSVASLAGPLLLGMLVGTLAAGGFASGSSTARLSARGPWLGLVPLTVGLLTVSLFAYLAATYLTVEARAAAEPALADDFRARALAAGCAVGILAPAALVLSARAAPLLHRGLIGRPWSWPLLVATVLVSLAAMGALVGRRFGWARVLVAAQAAGLVTGWGAGQYPYLVVPDLTLQAASAPPLTQRLLVYALLTGAVVLLPCLYFLFSVFKPGRAWVEGLDRTNDQN